MPEGDLGGDQRQRLTEYPPRFRARLSGRIVQITYSAAGQPLRFEAILEVVKSRPLPPATAHQLTGIPIVEVLTDDDLDENDEIAAETDDDDADDASPLAIEETNSESEHSFPQYRVRMHRPKTATPLYPKFAPFATGDRVTLIWHGQREVQGIVAGSFLRCSGMTSRTGQNTQMCNPRYEIVPGLMPLISSSHA